MTIATILTKGQILQKALSKEFGDKPYYDYLNEEEIRLIHGAMEQYVTQRELYNFRWINAAFQKPQLMPKINVSPKVWAICRDEMLLMQYVFIDSDDEMARGYYWANCYGDMNRNPVVDDDYPVSYWQYIPCLAEFKFRMRGMEAESIELIK